MKCIWILAVTFCIALAGGGLEAQQEENLIPNPSLEDPVGENGAPKGWYFFKDEAGDFEHAIVEGGHTGDKCYKVSGSGKWAGAAGPSQTFDATQRYVASGWVKVEGEEAKGTIKVDYFDAERKYLGHTLAGFLSGPSDWKQITAVSREKAFPEARFVGLAVMMNGKGAVYTDDLSLVKREPLASEAATNLLGNGSAESGVGEMPAGYYPVHDENAHPTFEWSTDNPHSGQRCLHIKREHENAQIKGEHEYAVLGHEPVKYDPDKTYVAKGWGRVKEGDAVLKIDYFNGENWLGESTSDPVPTDNTWAEATVAVDKDKFPGVNRISVAVALQGNGEAWFDDLVLETQ